MPLTSRAPGIDNKEWDQYAKTMSSFKKETTAYWSITPLTIWWRDMQNTMLTLSCAFR